MIASRGGACQDPGGRLELRQLDRSARGESSGAVIAIAWAVCSGPVVALCLRADASAWVALCVYQFGCALATRVVRGGLGRRPATARLLGVAIATAAIVVALGFAARWLGFFPRPRPIWQAWGLEPPGDMWLVLVFATLNPWIEERFWRGALLDDPVRRRVGARGARALAVWGFCPLHAVFLLRSFDALSGWLCTGGVLLAAILWTSARERSGSAWWAAASHQGADVGVVCLYWLWLRA